jgi:NAD(P)-dependent dehydrogenase (short-subunit alcohol dehydrogenase family)
MRVEERQKLRRRVAEGTPVRRLGIPEDVAQAAVLPMTCLQVTGSVLEVN